MNTIKLQVKTLELAVVKARLAAIATLFPDYTDLSIRYCGWAITADRHKDTVFAYSGIDINPSKIGTTRFLGKVDGKWIYCWPTTDGDGDRPEWYVRFSTEQYIDVRF